MINYLANCKLTDKHINDLSNELKLDLSNLNKFNLDVIHTNIFKKAFIVFNNPPHYTLAYNNIYSRWNKEDKNTLYDELNKYLLQFYIEEYKTKINEIISIDEQNVEIHQVSALTKPDPNSIVDGVCTVCKENVDDPDSHVCSKTISTEITDLKEMVTSIEQFKNKFIKK